MTQSNCPLVSLKGFLLYSFRTAKLAKKLNAFLNSMNSSTDTPRLFTYLKIMATRAANNDCRFIKKIALALLSWADGLRYTAREKPLDETLSKDSS
jgi:hypothetical protein